MPRTEVRAFASIDELEGANHFVVIGEGLAHSHDDDVCDFAEFACEKILRYDFICRKRAYDAARSARAEGAPHCASDLRGDALREAARGGNENGLDVVAVFEPDEKLGSAVFRFGCFENLGFRKGKFYFECFAEIFRERRCLVPASDVVAVERLENLIGTEGPKTAFLQDRFPFVGQNAPCFCHKLFALSLWFFFLTFSNAEIIP